MAHLRSLTLFSASSIFVALFIVGCGDASSDDENEGTAAKVSSAIKVSARSCPPDPHTGAVYQQQASRIARYLLGGPSPFPGPPSSGHGAPPPPDPRDPSTPDMTNPSCIAAKQCVDVIKSAIDQRYMVPASGGMNTACGMQAGLIMLSVNTGLRDEDYVLVADCATQLDGCWGVGVSGFFYPDPAGFSYNRNMATDKIYLDPEPAHLTADLGTSTGATAAAVYVNTAVPTSVIRWGGAYASTGFPPAAGTPCSTSYLAAGSDTPMMIQAGPSNYRRCF